MSRVVNADDVGRLVKIRCSEEERKSWLTVLCRTTEFQGDWVVWGWCGVAGFTCRFPAKVWWGVNVEVTSAGGAVNESGRQ
ncbi:MAG: hypothetical protein CMM01_02975 [Rhodopirellula sp.]|nr:hypothetical protein [Rhodopirellula sp.]